MELSEREKEQMEVFRHVLERACRHGPQRVPFVGDVIIALYCWVLNGCIEQKEYEIAELIHMKIQKSIHDVLKEIHNGNP